jgi:hypothetical protein
MMMKQLICSIALLLVPALALGDAPATRPAALRVAVYRDDGSPEASGAAVENCLKVSAFFKYKRVDAQAIRDGALADVDVLVQPGGSGSAQAKALQLAGRNRIIDFVKNGGGYVGICGGAYLGTSCYSWSLHLLNAAVVDREHWARGKGFVKLQFTPAGKDLFGSSQNVIDCLYHQGPLLAPDDKPDLPAYEPLAIFQTEVALNGAPKGVMIGTTAIARGMFDKGHVILISPHPEKTDGLDEMIRRAVDWSAGLPPAASDALTQTTAAVHPKSDSDPAGE